MLCVCNIYRRMCMHVYVLCVRNIYTDEYACMYTYIVQCIPTNLHGCSTITFAGFWFCQHKRKFASRRLQTFYAFFFSKKRKITIVFFCSKKLIDTSCNLNVIYTILLASNTRSAIDRTLGRSKPFFPERGLQLAKKHGSFPRAYTYGASATDTEEYTHTYTYIASVVFICICMYIYR